MAIYCLATIAYPVTYPWLGLGFELVFDFTGNVCCVFCRKIQTTSQYVANYSNGIETCAWLCQWNGGRVKYFYHIIFSMSLYCEPFTCTLFLGDRRVPGRMTKFFSLRFSRSPILPHSPPCKLSGDGCSCFDRRRIYHLL